MAVEIIRNHQLFVKDKGFAGKVKNFTPPALTMLTEDFRAGNMDMAIAIDMGMEAMECSWVLTSVEKGVLGESLTAGVVNVKVRAAQVDADGNVRPVVFEMNGKITSNEWGALEAGTITEITCKMRPSFYKLTIDSAVVHEIDAENMVRIINGVDQLAAIREAMGV